MCGVAGRLKAYFYKTDTEFVTVSLADSGGCVAKYTCQENSWQLAEESRLYTAAADCERLDCWQELVEQAALTISRKGWQAIPLLYIVPEKEQLSYALNLPPGLTREQQQEAAYWELDDKLLAQGLSAENFACVCSSNEAAGSSCTITGVSKGYLREVETAFSQAELYLADIVPALGVMAYLNSSQREQAGFKGRSGAGWAVKHVLKAWLIFWLMVGIVVLSADLIHYRQAAVMAEKQQNELALLATEEQEMQSLTALAADIAAREKKIQIINQQAMPWYSLLVHLGTHTVAGVALMGVNVSADGKLCLEGQAVNYDCLAEFVGRCEEDRDFFTQGITLTDSAVVKGSSMEPDKVKFSVSVMNWESKKDGQNPDETKNMQ